MIRLGSLSGSTRRWKDLINAGSLKSLKEGGTIVEWQKGLGWDGIHIGPSEKTIEATILTLRFFLQDNENTSLRNMAELYLHLNIEPRLPTRFCEVRDQVNSYLDAPSNLWISEEAPMTHRQILNLFVNGDLAHANDAMTESNYRAICQTAFFPLFQVDFSRTVQLIMLALNEMKQINLIALCQLRVSVIP